MVVGPSRRVDSSCQWCCEEAAHVYMLGLCTMLTVVCNCTRCRSRGPRWGSQVLLSACRALTGDAPCVCFFLLRVSLIKTELREPTPFVSDHLQHVFVQGPTSRGHRDTAPTKFGDWRRQLGGACPTDFQKFIFWVHSRATQSLTAAFMRLPLQICLYSTSVNSVNCNRNWNGKTGKSISVKLKLKWELTGKCQKNLTEIVTD